MFIKRRLPAFLVFLGSALTCCHAADDWNGLWRILSFSEANPSVNHIFIAGETADQVRFHAGENARPMKIRELKFEDTKLFLRVDQSGKQPLPLVFELTRSGDRVEGEWKFYHFQLPQPMTGPAKGIRIHRLEEWAPWETAERHREERFLDINSYLAENAPLGNFEKFEKYWTGIEPAYYLIVQSWLYGVGEDPSGDRRLRLEEWYGFLKKKENRQRIGELARIVEEARDNVRALNNGLFPHFIVGAFSPEAMESRSFWSGTPDPEEEKACACKLDRNEHFVLFNPARILGENGIRSLDFRKNLYRALLWTMPARLEDELLRQGVAYQLAVRDEGTELPAIDPANLKQMVGEVVNRMENSQATLSVPAVNDADSLIGEPVPAVAFHFAGSLLEKQSMHSVILMAAVQNRVVREWQSYTKSILKPAGPRKVTKAN